MMVTRKLPIAAAMASLMAAPITGFADEDEVPFDEARLFLELNDTDGDLGIHGKVDGDEWRYLEIEDPYDRKMANIWIRGRLRRQGLTELFFESAEPTFDELDPERFFRRFPEGEYDIEGYTLDWEERESEVYLSHVIPAAPYEVSVGGYPMASKEACDGEGDEPIPIVDPEELEDEEVPFEWAAVTESHAARHGPDGDEPREIALGTDGIIDVAYYEVVVEIDDTDFKQTAIIPGDQTEWDMSDDFFELADAEEECPDDSGRMCAQYKYEILVRTYVYEDVEPVYVDEDEEEQLLGNKSAVESCFLVPEDD